MKDAAYRAARRRVIRRLVLQIAFVANVLFFILATLDILRTPRADPVGSAFVFALLWGTILVVHAMYAFNLFGQRIHQATLRELEHEMPGEKPKRQRLAFSDDGELVDIQEDIPETRHKSNSL
ncbi:MAG TPA: hypothetical protein VMT34_00125 [Aggregatilineales bacterium]|nr:hypothetical protein [Aggregatilineales bacterium]